MALYAFDGTWNDSSVPDSQRNTNEDTNVFRFFQVYNEHKTYIDGVGTRYGRLGKYIGGFTGAGWEMRIKEQFEALTELFNNGDTSIDIIGYSRGAAIARMFVDHLEQNYEKLLENNQSLLAPPRVRFLGLFDTVASFGIPWTENEHSFKKEVPDFVDAAYHAMALDETRETFGIERCLGNRDKITEVWFRGGHGDIGGNATYTNRQSEVSNSERTNIALRWMLDKATACNLPLEKNKITTQADNEAPITALDEKIRIGKVGTLSRRIHVGDLVHHSMEDTELTCGIDGRQLRRINVLTRIEDENLQIQAESIHWLPPLGHKRESDNILVDDLEPSIVQLSMRRYPFDVLPARTWTAWFNLWQIENPGLDVERAEEFWAPNDADRALAWDIYIELQTRITIQMLEDGEGDDITALNSIYQLFPITRECLKRHGLSCSNSGTLISLFLNQNVRGFLANWHRISIAEKWKDQPGVIHSEFRSALREMQPILKSFAKVLAHLADAKLD